MWWLDRDLGPLLSQWTNGVSTKPLVYVCCHGNIPYIYTRTFCLIWNTSNCTSLITWVCVCLLNSSLCYIFSDQGSLLWNLIIGIFDGGVIPISFLVRDVSITVQQILFHMVHMYDSRYIGTYSWTLSSFVNIYSKIYIDNSFTFPRYESDK
mgnify:CR=1 FL=1